MKKIRLRLNKVTVASLTDADMSLIHGATFIRPSCECTNTKSCTFLYDCCPPPEKLIVNTGDC